MPSRVRDVILRALFDPKFYNLLISNIDKAVQEYELTNEELEILRSPSKELYKYIEPEISSNFAVASDGKQPPPPTSVTVVVIAVVAITVFVAVISSEQKLREYQAYSTLIDAIKNSSGIERVDLIKTLVNEISKEES